MRTDSFPCPYCDTGTMFEGSLGGDINKNMVICYDCGECIVYDDISDDLLGMPTGVKQELFTGILEYSGITDFDADNDDYYTHTFSDSAGTGVPEFTITITEGRLQQPPVPPMDVDDYSDDGLAVSVTIDAGEMEVLDDGDRIIRSAKIDGINIEWNNYAEEDF